MLKNGIPQGETPFEFDAPFSVEESKPATHYSKPRQVKMFPDEHGVKELKPASYVYKWFMSIAVDEFHLYAYRPRAGDRQQTNSDINAFNPPITENELRRAISELLDDQPKRQNIHMTDVPMIVSRYRARHKLRGEPEFSPPLDDEGREMTWCYNENGDVVWTKQV